MSIMKEVDNETLGRQESFNLANLLQFNNDLDSTKAQLAEEVQTAADVAEQQEQAHARMREMARGLIVAVTAAKDQRVARRLAQGKMHDAEAVIVRLEREIVAHQNQV